MAIYKFEASIRSGYLALDFSSVFFKNSLNKQLSKKVYPKSSTLIYALSSLSQLSYTKNISLLLLMQSRPFFFLQYI